ncbi:acyl-CoA synthetase [Acidisphaera sp. L21]|uniref:acyl-CoA synthetase n=1 Tax=Acidisphaera sp. L21 TaxID=1641851 RepID=UPI00131AECB1|nr:acyl-CoA synthetase [Acidisphaera sp. L21]
MLIRGSSYEDTVARFVWDVPPRFNIAYAVCERHVGAGREALIYQDANGAVTRYSFEDLLDLSRRFANALIALGVQRGDRVAILLPQGPETLVAHLAAYRMGAIALPLFSLFGPEAIEYRLRDSEACVVVTADVGLAKIQPIWAGLPTLRTVIDIEGGRGPNVLGFQDLMSRASSSHACVDTLADDPALILYTSGTTGQPKGVLHAHRVLLGILPGVEFPHDFFPQQGDRIWTPADWAWAGGLLDVLLPALYHAIPVVACRLPKFDADIAFDLLRRHEIRNAFMPPTALKIMRQQAAPRSPVQMRSVASGGERMGADMLDWGRATFGVTINEFYGQTEVNLVIGNCATLMPTRDGSMGRAVPGHRVAVIGEDGAVLPAGQAGSIAVRAPDPVMFLQYWRNPDATARKFRGDWLLTGDLGVCDDAGYFWFHGRDDDVIISAGYRIGPDEVEGCVAGHPAVAMVAVIGVPDALRGEVVKAFVVPRDGFDPGPELVADIQAYVKTRLSGHEYPREIEFLDALPMTITGKIMRRELRNRRSPG